MAALVAVVEAVVVREAAVVAAVAAEVAAVADLPKHLCFGNQRTQFV